VISTSLYPSYFDMDPLIDVDGLRLLDGYIRERLERRLMAERDLAFYTGPLVLDEGAPTVPGSRMVYLSRMDGSDNYYELDRCELWHASEEAQEFSELMDFIGTLPFAATGRMLIMYDPEGRAVTAHRDHDSSDLSHEFVWLRTNCDKPFYMLNPETGEKSYVAGHSAWFDTVNQYHGADQTGELAWSIRIDGRFDEALRATIPEARGCSASRAALLTAATQRV
jgi:hypothetical protein